MKQILIKLHWLTSSQFGIDPLRLWRSVCGLPTFISDWWKFRKTYTGKITIMPCLHDRFEEGGTTKSEYFWQDLLVSRWVYEARPQLHVDVGSRVDGFVAHVASFREVEVFDIRNITTQVPGIVFRQADFQSMKSVTSYTNGGGYCDSLSCLHAIEHFGLGRYGDEINPFGYASGIKTMSKLLKPGGKFYLSTPIGRERVEFNANWVFDPRTIIRVTSSEGLQLEQLTVISQYGVVQNIQISEDSLLKLAIQTYNLAIFVFTKLIY